MRYAYRQNFGLPSLGAVSQRILAICCVLALVFAPAADAVAAGDDSISVFDYSIVESSNSEKSSISHFDRLSDNTKSKNVSSANVEDP
ncbi:MAG: hypothetical protein V1754_00715, partial [Pseudomonadota bacterium]